MNDLVPKALSLITDCPEKSRVSCAIGAAYTALAMERVLPVIHGGPGCLAQSRGPLATINGAQSSWSFPENLVPSTNFGESEVVFGGNEKLRALLRSVLETYDTEAVVVLSGCTSAIVGDDVDEVVRSFGSSEVPVIAADLTGFKGNNLWGHGQVLRALASRFLEPAGAVNPRQVNVLGVVPYYDPFWEGTLDRLGELLKLVGLEPNIFYGKGRGLAEFKKIPAGAVNLVLGPWVDVDLADEFNEQFGTPVFHFTHVPVGPSETARFLRGLAEVIAVDGASLETYLKQEDERYYYYIQKSLSFTYGCKVLPKQFLIHASAAVALSLTKYLVNDLGLVPLKVYIPEDVPEEHQERVNAYFQDLEWTGGVEVLFTNDGGVADPEIRQRRFLHKPLLLGSTWDEQLAAQLDLNFIPVSAPLGNFLIFDKTYFGFRGALELYGEIYSQALAVGD